MVLTLHAITRAASGLYSCNASNGVGPEARAHIKVSRVFFYIHCIFHQKLHVLFPPHVRAIQPIVEGGAGYQARLTCVVHSSPMSEVRLVFVFVFVFVFIFVFFVFVFVFEFVFVTGSVLYFCV